MRMALAVAAEAAASSDVPVGAVVVDADGRAAGVLAGAPAPGGAGSSAADGGREGGRGQEPPR